MFSRESEILPCRRSLNPTSTDEMPKIPHPPLLQKLIKCDVPDISLVSDTGSDVEKEPYSGLHRRINHPTLQSKSNGVLFSERTSRTENLNNIHCKDTLPSEVSGKNISKQHVQTLNLDSALSKEIVENFKLPNAEENTKCLSLSEQSIDTREYLKRQDEKLDAIQEQVSRVLAQNQQRYHSPSSVSDGNMENNLPVLLTSFKDPEVSPNRTSCMSVHKEELLIKCLLSQSEQIQKLQEQVNWLLHKTTELASLNASGNDSPECPSIAPTTNPLELEGLEHRLLEAANKPSDAVETALCQTEVTKQSTSTMTSLTFNGNDKFVIHKKMTVVTDSSKYQKEVSAQCSFATNGVPTPERPVVAKNVVSSARRSEGKQTRRSSKCSPKCNCLQRNRIASGSSDVVSPDEELVQPSPIRNRSPLINQERRNEEGVELNNVESKIEKYIPNYENILKNVNEMILENGTEYHTPPSGKKKTPKSSSRSRDKHITLPKTTKSPTTQIRKTEYKRITGQKNSSTTSSNTSLDSMPHTPEQRKHRPQKTVQSTTKPIDITEESSTATRYGLSSPNLSVATKQYLENYGLVQDKNNDSERTKSSRKVRTSLSKRYPR